MQVIECWEVKVWNGTDRYNHEFYLSSEAEAERWLRNNPRGYTRKTTICLFDSLEEREANHSEAIKKRALSKLTYLERKALGFGSWVE